MSQISRHFIQIRVQIKPIPDVGELLVDSLDLRLLALAVADVGDEDGEAAHRVAAHRRHHGEGRGYLDGEGNGGIGRTSLGLCKICQCHKKT